VINVLARSDQDLTRETVFYCWKEIKVYTQFYDPTEINPKNITLKLAQNPPPVATDLNIWFQRVLCYVWYCTAHQRYRLRARMEHKMKPIITIFVAIVPCLWMGRFDAFGEERIWLCILQEWMPKIGMRKSRI
jgi:hypothetical protein